MVLDKRLCVERKELTRHGAIRSAGRILHDTGQEHLLERLKRVGGKYDVNYKPKIINHHREKVERVRWDPKGTLNFCFCEYTPPRNIQHARR